MVLDLVNVEVIALAKQGKKYDEIIKYYYKDVEISE